jgi:hypothetical protein
MSKEAIRNLYRRGLAVPEGEAATVDVALSGRCVRVRLRCSRGVIVVATAESGPAAVALAEALQNYAVFFTCQSID